MNNTISKNLKRLRISKHFTQEQAAEYLGVSAQSISRWECGNTLPDILMLPKIAELYCVTVDELYKDTSVAYANYAQRLAAVYESTKEPEDFIRADLEFRRLIKKGDFSTEDLRLYGILHHFMMLYCTDKAIELFDKVIEKGTNEDENIFWQTKRQKILLYSQIGKGRESIDSALKSVDKNSECAEEWICLIEAYRYNKEEKRAYDCFLKAVKKFPENAILYVYGGDICKDLKRYHEAFSYWDKALFLDNSLYDAKYSMGFCYEELGEYQKAYDIWYEIANELKAGGYENESKYPLKSAEKCKKKLNMQE